VANPTERAQLDRLDTFAHGFWNALETAKIYASSPSYWNFWKKFWTGGTPDRPEVMDAATNAAAAAAGEEAAAQRIAATPENQAFAAGFTTLAQGNAANVAIDTRNAARLWNQPGVDPLGVPLWAWVAGAVGLFLVLRK
jgi:hypothetical protein